MIIYEFLAGGEGAIEEFKNELTVKDCASLDAKLKMMSTMDALQLIGHISLCAPLPQAYTATEYRELKKLHAKGSVQLRPIYVLGPDKGSVTFLAGAKELNSRLEPESAPDRALRRLAQLRADPSLRRLYSVPE